MGALALREKMRGIFIACAVAAMMLLSCTAELEVPEHVSQNAGSTETAQVATAGAELAQETTQDGWGASRKLLGRRDVRRRRRRRRRWWGSWRERTQKNAARERANKEWSESGTNQQGASCKGAFRKGAHQQGEVCKGAHQQGEIKQGKSRQGEELQRESQEGCRQT